MRPAQIGDVCVLLTTTNPSERETLRQRQTRLQARWGGALIEEVHLTCQRFMIDASALPALRQGLEKGLKKMKPIDLRAIAYQLLFVPALDSNMLKWEVKVSNALREFAGLLEKELRENNVTPLYRAGFVSSLVSALKDVTDISLEEVNRSEPFPYYLFQADKVTFSRIKGPDDFEILADFGLSAK